MSVLPGSCATTIAAGIDDWIYVTGCDPDDKGNRGIYARHGVEGSWAQISQGPFRGTLVTADLSNIKWFGSDAAGPNMLYVLASNGLFHYDGHRWRDTNFPTYPHPYPHYECIPGTVSAARGWNYSSEVMGTGGEAPILIGACDGKSYLFNPSTDAWLPLNMPYDAGLGPQQVSISSGALATLWQVSYTGEISYFQFPHYPAPASGTQRLPGCARSIADSGDGYPWIAGCDSGRAGYLYWWNGTGWTLKYVTDFVFVAVAPDTGRVWAIDVDHQIWVQDCPLRNPYCSPQ
jgi:hypothetical protein